VIGIPVARLLRVSILQHSRQGEVHLELLDPLAADRLADALFLFSAQAAPTAGFLTPHTGLESVCAILTAQAQGGVHSGLTQTRLFNELHHANTLVVHADDLLAAFVQHFSRLLTDIFFLHLLLAQTRSISSFINRAWSNWSAR
jgi:predicted hotdog family 3-hydroxylacyl-ACP dehydratase